MRGVAAFAFNGLDERGFLAADIAAEPGADFDVEGEVRAEELLSEITLGPAWSMAVFRRCLER